MPYSESENPRWHREKTPILVIVHFIYPIAVCLHLVNTFYY